MGITVEFNPDLALRNFSEFQKGNRKLEECLPKVLEVGKTYAFLKKEQRLYRLHGEIPLLETAGNGILSRPKASINMLEVTHFIDDNVIRTKGKYKIIEVFTDDKIHFDGFEKLTT